MATPAGAPLPLERGAPPPVCPIPFPGKHLAPGGEAVCPHVRGIKQSWFNCSSFEHDGQPEGRVKRNRPVIAGRTRQSVTSGISNTRRDHVSRFTFHSAIPI